MIRHRLPLDPVLAEIASAAPSSDVSIFEIDPVEARRAFDAAIFGARDEANLAQVGATKDAVIDCAGVKVPVRIYRPRAAGVYPTVLFFHGGGFMLGGIAQMDDIARRLCRDVDAVVVSVGYRLAPESPFPAALDDAVAITEWAAEHAQELGGDPTRVGLAGESAGGNLAASAAIVARDRGLFLTAQLLIVPGVDLAPMLDSQDAPLLNARDLRALAQRYLGPVIAQVRAFPPSPLYAADLSGLPPAVIGVAGYDLLAPSGIAFAQRLRQADVSVSLHCFEDLFHPFLAFADVSPAAARASDILCADFAAALRGQTAARHHA